MFPQDSKRLFCLFGIIVRNSDIQSFSLSNDICQRPHRFFNRCLRVRTMRIEDINIFQTHPFQALIQACHQILATSPVTIRTGPHIISGFCRNNKLIPVQPQTFLQDTTEVFLCRSIYRTVVIGKIKMCNPIVESSMRNLNKVTERIHTTKIMPQS